MRWRADILSVQNKPYQPVMSGKVPYDTFKIKNEEFLNKRPKTTTEPNRVNDRRGTQYSTVTGFTNMSTTNTFKQAKSVKTPSTLKHSSASSVNGMTEKQSSLNDDESEASTNISLLSFENEPILKERKIYGQFNYVSFFEKYMNRRARFKVPSNFMPKYPSEDDLVGVTLRDLLDRHEFKRLYELSDVRWARASRLRSNSACGQLTEHEFFKIGVEKKRRRKSGLKKRRRESIECGTKLAIEKRFSQIEINCLNENELRKVRGKNSEMGDVDWRKSLLSDKETKETSILLPSFHARDIQQPEVYVMGGKTSLNHSDSASSNKINKTDPKDTINTKQLKNPYFNIESKLRAYIKNNRQVHSEKGPVSLNKPKFAISRHQISTGPFIVYKDTAIKKDMNNNEKKDENSYLKVGNSLKNLIREDLRVNRGPIYFAQLTEENLELYDQVKEITEKDKFLYIFDWMLGIDTEQCSHFYSNPFCTNTEVNTDFMNFNTESLSPSKPGTSVKNCMDPLENAKIEYELSNRLPLRRHRSVFSDKHGFFEVKDKRSLAVSREYTTYLHLKNTAANQPNVKLNQLSQNQLNKEINEDLRKKLLLNDMIFTRMQLDLFVL